MVELVINAKTAMFSFVFLRLELPSPPSLTNMQGSSASKLHS